jgi:hypothetical protein
VVFFSIIESFRITTTEAISARIIGIHIENNVVGKIDDRVVSHAGRIGEIGARRKRWRRDFELIRR